MSDEPLYCRTCGADDFCCDCPDPTAPGPYCEVCGVIPRRPEVDCQRTGRPCEPAEGRDE